MSDLFAKKLADSLSYFLKLKTAIEIFLNFLGKLLLIGFFKIVIIDLFKEAESYFVNTVKDPHCHTLC